MERVRNVFGPQSPDIQAFTVYHELRMKETTLFHWKRGREPKPGTKAGTKAGGIEGTGRQASGIPFKLQDLPAGPARGRIKFSLNLNKSILFTC